MPIIYTYPSATPVAEDLLLISDVSSTNPTKATRKCTIGDVVSLVGALVPGGGTVTSVGLQAGTTGLTIATTTTNPITTTGTFTIGGTLVAANGGTGHNSYAVGDILYASGATAFTKLTAGALNYVLTSGGPGVAPSWSATGATGVTSFRVTAADLPGLTPTGVTTGAIALGGNLEVGGGGTGQTTFPAGYFLKGNVTGAIASSQYVNLTSEVTGILPVPNGGTGAATLTDGGFVLGSGTAAVTITAQPTNGELPIGNTGTDPTLATITAGANITVTNGAGSITIASTAGAPSKITYDNQLTLRGGTSGTYTPNVARLAQYWTLGDYVYMEFYMEWNQALHGCVGTVIMENLPKDAAGVGATIDQGSCLVTVNDGWGTSHTTPAPTVGRTGVTAVDEIIFRGPNYNNGGPLTDTLWTYCNGDADPAVWKLAGTAWWLQSI